MKKFIVFTLMILAVIFTAALPLAQNSHFYMLDDTVLGALGQWYHVGDLLIHGKLPVFDVNYYAGGNYLAEGQWGAYSPLMWGIGLIVYFSENYVITLTAIKIASLIILAIAGYLLSRSYRISPEWSSLLGFFVSSMGYIRFTTATNWVSDLFSFTFFILTWWAYRKYVLDKWNIVVPFFFAFFLITIGYVYGVMYLVILLIVHFITSLARRDWLMVRRIFWFDLLALMVSLAVFMPGVLTGAVTIREQGILNNDNLSPTFNDLINTFFPFSENSLNRFIPFNTIYSDYMTWVGALLVFVNYKGVKARFKALVKEEGGLFVSWIGLVVFSLFLLLAPDQMGPIRFPFRNLPYFGFFLILGLAWLLQKNTYKFTPLRWVGFCGLVVFLFFLNWSQYPPLADRYLIGSLLLLAAGLLIFLFSKVSRRAGWFYALILLFSIGISGLQAVRYYDYVYDPSEEKPRVIINNGLYTKSQIREASLKVTGSLAVFGNLNFPGGVEMPGGDMRDNQILANYFYFMENPTINTYTTISFKAFYKKYDFHTFQGQTTTRGVNKLFSLNQDYGLTWADLLAIDNVQIYQPLRLKKVHTNTDEEYYQLDKATYKNYRETPPAGWHLSLTGDNYYVLSRDQVINQVGGITGQTGGPANLKVIRSDDRETRFVVDSQANQSVTLTLSRIAWPGYTVSHARLNKPLDGYLVNVTVGKEDFGKTITVRFNPPFYKEGKILMAASLVILLITAVLQIIWSLLRKRKKKPLKVKF